MCRPSQGPEKAAWEVSKPAAATAPDTSSLGTSAAGWTPKAVQGGQNTPDQRSQEQALPGKGDQFWGHLPDNTVGQIDRSHPQVLFGEGLNLGHWSICSVHDPAGGPCLP